MSQTEEPFVISSKQMCTPNYFRIVVSFLYFYVSLQQFLSSLEESSYAGKTPGVQKPNTGSISIRLWIAQTVTPKECIL